MIKYARSSLLVFVLLDLVECFTSSQAILVVCWMMIHQIFFIFSGRLYHATFGLILNIIAELLAILVSNWTRHFKIYIKLWLWFKFFGNIWREIIIKSNPFVRNSLKTFGTISIELVWKLIFVRDLVNVVFWYHAN